MNEPKHDALRHLLLVELSTLREACLRMEAEDAPPSGPPRTPSALDDEDQLGQSAKDAIEAFFNSGDDFITQFNAGEGTILRGDFLKNV
ncbi:hypothetical protein AGDE_00879 [Angomonas deanei]|uniref:Uncharacterized protein n=1 Tax=Angomonas deanei TaxID=59799 RepID=A0A7G2C698_9TRYP|nr:hypothetical protein AGDE_00879 [Angomonas deanei]CAD2213452.1 hypothetical protein, conserved [Angomonas deanei]|eukprot:EPY43044.1 hypothetical protein AGDE_00879 [Angomonas deanei]